jgi:protein SHQ1
MTITPSFQLRQSATHIFLEISVPHVRIAVEEIQLTLTDADRQLHWYAPPIYLLRLNFAPYQFRSIEEEEIVNEDTNETTVTRTACQASYLPHIDHGVIRIQLEKRIPEQHWENLDLLGQWKPPTMPQWLRAVVAAEEGAATEEDRKEPHPPLPDGSSELDAGDVPRAAAGFGFDRRFRDNIFRDLTRDGLGKEMLECPWPSPVMDDATEYSIQSRRRILRIEAYENRLFSAERYRQDLYHLEDDFIYQTALSMQPHWALAPAEEEEEPFFTPSERQLLATIPYPLLDPPVTVPRTVSEASRHQRLCLGLLDILFAYVYDHVTTDGDPTVESAWTIFILSTSLSWCDDWLDDGSEAVEDALALVPAVLCSSLRRALIYPYLRSWEFAGFLWRQVATLVRRGVRTILRSLLQVRSILDRSELYYFGNKLYVDPYLIWLQQYPSMSYLETNLLAPMAQRIVECLDSAEQWWRIKENLGLNLIEIETNGWEEESLNVVEDAGREDRPDASSSSSEGDGTSEEEDEEDDESGSSVSEGEDTGKSTINRILSTIPEREEIHEEQPQGANGLTGDLQRLCIDGDHHPFDIFLGSKRNLQTPHSEMNPSSTKRAPLIQEVD